MFFAIKILQKKIEACCMCFSILGFLHDCRHDAWNFYSGAVLCRILKLKLPTSVKTTYKRVFSGKKKKNCLGEMQLSKEGIEGRNQLLQDMLYCTSPQDINFQYRTQLTILTFDSHQILVRFWSDSSQILLRFLSDSHQILIRFSSLSDLGKFSVCPFQSQRI